MGLKCYICRRTASKSNGISLHGFPKNPVMRKKWIDACDLLPSDDLTQVRICSVHFNEMDIDRGNKFATRNTLSTNAVPCIGMKNKTCSRSVTENTLNTNEVEIINIQQLQFPKQASGKGPVQQCNNFINQCRFVTTDATVECEVTQNVRISDKGCDSVTRKGFFKPRYVSEISTSHLATPEGVKRVLNLVQDTDKKKSKLIKSLQDQNRKLMKQIFTLKQKIAHLKNMVSSGSGDILLVQRVNKELELEQEYKCSSCTFTTKALEVMMMHRKSHCRGVHTWGTPKRYRSLAAKRPKRYWSKEEEPREKKRKIHSPKRDSKEHSPPEESSTLIEDILSTLDNQTENHSELEAQVYLAKCKTKIICKLIDKLSDKTLGTLRSKILEDCMNDQNKPQLCTTENGDIMAEKREVIAPDESVSPRKNKWSIRGSTEKTHVKIAEVIGKNVPEKLDHPSSLVEDQKKIMTNETTCARHKESEGIRTIELTVKRADRMEKSFEKDNILEDESSTDGSIRCDDKSPREEDIMDEPIENIEETLEAIVDEEVEDITMADIRDSEFIIKEKPEIEQVIVEELVEQLTTSDVDEKADVKIVESKGQVIEEGCEKEPGAFATTGTDITQQVIEEQPEGEFRKEDLIDKERDVIIVSNTQNIEETIATERFDDEMDLQINTIQESSQENNTEVSMKEVHLSNDKRDKVTDNVSQLIQDISAAEKSACVVQSLPERSVPQPASEVEVQCASSADEDKTKFSVQKNLPHSRQEEPPATALASLDEDKYDFAKSTSNYSSVATPSKHEDEANSSNSTSVDQIPKDHTYTRDLSVGLQFCKPDTSVRKQSFREPIVQAKNEYNREETSAAPLVTCVAPPLHTEEVIQQSAVLTTSSTDEQMPLVIGIKRPIAKTMVQDKVVAPVVVSQHPVVPTTLAEVEPKTQLLQLPSAKLIPTAQGIPRPGTYMIVPQNAILPSKCVDKTDLKQIATSRAGNLTTDPAGSKINNVTNQRSQSMLCTNKVRRSAEPSTNVVVKTQQPVEGHKAILAGHTAARLEVPVKNVLQTRIQKVVTTSTPSKPQKTTLIKIVHGQTIETIQVTDEDLKKQVSEQLETIRARSAMKPSERSPEVKAVQRKPARRSTGRKRHPNPTARPSTTNEANVVVKNETVSLITPKGRYVTAQAKPGVASEPKTTPTSPLNKLVIKDVLGNQTTITEGQILAVPSATVNGEPQAYTLITLDSRTGNELVRYLSEGRNKGAYLPLVPSLK